MFAGMLADAPGRAGQRIVQNHRLERILHPAFLIELEEARDVHVQRTAVLAGGESQLRADAGGGVGGTM